MNRKTVAKPSFPAKMDLSVGKPTKHTLNPLTKSTAPLLKLPLLKSQLVQSPSAKLAAPLSMPKQTVMAKQSVSIQGYGLDAEAARTRMVSKLAAHGIEDARVLNAMRSVLRHKFVDTALSNQAYEDTSLPIGWGQTISKPNVVARMIELLFEGKTGNLGRVLEIGTGCGYQAAVLSQIAHEVYSIERVAGLYEKARENFRPFRIKNTHLLFGDGMLGFPKGAPYTGIIAAAGGDAIPQAWLDQLAIGGRIVAPVTNSAIHLNGASSNGVSNEQSLVVIDKTVTGMKRTILEFVQFVPLKSGLA
jgi:protein-L-isoaspartate(D-aspartate) O-methyltransferase